MKLTIALTLGAALLLMSSSGTRIDDVDDYDLDSDNMDAFDELEDFYDDYDYEEKPKPHRHFWSGFYRALKIALRTLKGVNCTIKEVLRVRDACLEFLESSKSCSVEMTRQMRAIIESVNAIIKTCNDIIHVNTHICGNGTPTADNDDVPNVRTGSFCFARLLRKICILRRQIRRTMKLINALPADTGSCFYDACKELTSTFMTFPTNIKTCSKLTSGK